MWHTVSSELCFHPCVNLSTFSRCWQVSVCFFFYAVIENSHKNNEIRKYSRCVYREHAQLQKVQDNVQLGKRSLKCCECLKCSVLSTYALVRFYGTSLDDSSQRGRWLLLVCQKPMSQNSADHTDCLKTAFGRPHGPPASLELLLVLPTCPQQE